jgi:hypothetical protein
LLALLALLALERCSRWSVARVGALLALLALLALERWDLMKIERFEDIQAWQEARGLVSLVYSAIEANEGFRKVSRMISNLIKYLRSQTHPRT